MVLQHVHILAMVLYYSFIKSLALEESRYRVLASMCINSYNCTLICNYFNKKINKEGGERGGEGRKKETKEEKGRREKETAVGSSKK